MMELIRMADAPECVDRLAIAARDKKRPAEMVTEAFWVVGIAAHRLPNQLEALFWVAKPGVQLALLDNDQVVVGIEGDTALLMVLGSLVIAD